MEPDPCDLHDDKTVPVADLFGRIAAELRELTQTVDALQNLAGRLASGTAKRDSEAVRQLQEFDRLGQTLSGVADFIDALDGSVPEQWRVNPHPASRVLLLADLAVRLVSNAPAPMADVSVAGEFEFF
jgi:hypothetical protein